MDQVQLYTFELKLLPEEADQLLKEAGRAGLFPEDLLADFISDFTGSTRAGGTDEEEQANHWFKRRGYRENPANAFLSYLMNYGLLETVLQLQESADERQSDMAVRSRTRRLGYGCHSEGLFKALCAAGTGDRRCTAEFAFSYELWGLLHGRGDICAAGSTGASN